MNFWKKRRIEAYEEVEYEPISVLEILTEMKDLSELMTSLAYSALVLDSDPIGDEVEALAQRMDWLKYQMRLTASMSVRNKAEAKQVAGILQIADASEHIANAAEEMVEILDTDVEARPFLGKIMLDADDAVTTATVPEESRAVGASLGGMGLETETGVRVLAIRRGKRWVYDPNKDNLLQAGDVLLVRGQREGTNHLRKWMRGEEEEL
jgi:uncharacterized protein with PhoU and TrkA domain